MKIQCDYVRSNLKNNLEKAFIGASVTCVKEIWEQLCCVFLVLKLKLTDFNRRDIQTLQPNVALHDFSVDFSVSQILFESVDSLRVKSTEMLTSISLEDENGVK